MKYFFLGFIFFSLIFISGIGFSQSLSVLVYDTDKSPMIGAAIQLSAIEDSTISKAITTNNSGNAVFDNIPASLYKIRITYVGYQDQEKTILVKEESRSFEFFLEEKAHSLGVVTITEAKPLIRQEDDKTIIDPTPMLGISTNTLEILESTPGMFVDYETGIYLNSASPAVIYINGREQKLGKQDVMNLLRNLPPGSIEKIEVMRTPSTKYDAASSGGIINIIMKKGIKIGRFGNFNAGMNQGLFGNRFAGMSFNNSGSKGSFYINLNLNRNEMQEDLNSIRYYNLDTVLNQSSASVQLNRMGYIGYGLGYDISDHLSISYDGRIGYTDKSADAVSKSFIEDVYGFHMSESEDKILNVFEVWDVNQDFGINKKFDSLGSELDTKFSYSISETNSDQEYISSYTHPLNLIFQGNGENIQQRKFFLFQSDLTYQLPFEVKLETGVKSTWQNFSSTADYYSITDSATISDSSRTNAYSYKEGISAAYLQASKKIWGGILLKTGCRFEYTNMEGNQTIPADSKFLVSRADLFPYVYLSRPLPTIMGIELRTYMIYRKTISRPDYQNLNPYKKYIDPFLYETGNPDLKPQFTDNVEVNISYDDMPIFAVGKNYTKDIFSSVVYSDTNQAGVAVMTYDNLGKSKETYFKGMAGIPPGGKYFFAIGAQFNMSDYNGFYEGEPLAYKRGSWRLFTFHSLTLFKLTRITMYGFMMVKGQQGFYELDNFGSINFGITQSLLKKKLMISLSARDVMRTMLVGFKLDQGGISTQGDRYSDNMRFGINIRYNFGLGKKSERKGFNNYENDSEI